MNLDCSFQFYQWLKSVPPKNFSNVTNLLHIVCSVMFSPWENSINIAKLFCDKMLLCLWGFVIYGCVRKGALEKRAGLLPLFFWSFISLQDYYYPLRNLIATPVIFVTEHSYWHDQIQFVLLEVLSKRVLRWWSNGCFRDKIWQLLDSSVFL